MMFGRNDPANFGTVSIAMMTLFCMSTLTWSEVAYVEYHGCNVFEGGALVKDSEVIALRKVVYGQGYEHNFN